MLLSFLAIFFSLSQLQAKTIYFGNDRETVTVVHKEPTIFRFSSSVKTISKTDGFSISPVDRNDPDYSKLKVVPHFRKSKDKVEFILDDGQVVKVLLAVVSETMPSRTDSIYDFESKNSLLSRRDKRVFINEVELMKAMIKGSFVSGYKIKKPDKYVWTKSKNFKIKLLKVYVGEDLNGYVFKLRNTSRKHRRLIDLAKIKFGKTNLAVLAQIDNKELAKASFKKKRSTILRVVTKPTAVYSYLNLAFGAVKEEK
jgi:hypothetical protein